MEKDNNIKLKMTEESFNKRMAGYLLIFMQLKREDQFEIINDLLFKKPKKKKEIKK